MTTYWKEKLEGDWPGLVEVVDDQATYYPEWPSQHEARILEKPGDTNWVVFGRSYWTPIEIDEDYLMDIGL